MPERKPTVTVGFYLRERFSATGDALRSIIANTAQPYTLVIVDCGAPSAVRAEMEGIVRAHPDVRWVESDRFLYVNESRNRIAEATDTDYVCMIENAALVDAGWLSALVEASEATGAGVASPQLYEPTALGGRVPHHDYGFAALEVRERNGVTERACIASASLRADRFSRTEPFVVSSVEGHCNFFSRAALQALGPFDESLTAATHVDLCCRVQALGIKMISVPASRVTHVPMRWIREDERAFYAFRWNVARAAQSRDTILRRWNLANIADVADFAVAQLRRTNPLTWNLHRLRHAPEYFAQRFAALRR